MIMGIPNYNLKILYTLKFYHKLLLEKISDFQLLKGIIRFNYGFWKRKLRHPKYVHEDDIGFWYTMGEMKELAGKNNYKIDFFYSIYPPYGYRFHAK